ncbi:hypothetical protein DYH09_24510 [bacterium CPR1]|nr:hypothetical protein [bacterium CPR1]
MEIKQYSLGSLSHASSVVTDQATRTVLVVDPQRDVDEYLQETEAMGVTIKEEVLTHFHADFVSGHLELQKRTGAAISLGEKARPEYDIVPSREEVVICGKARLEARDARLNHSQRVDLGDTVRDANVPLSFARVLELQQAGAQVLDTRMPDDFAEFHLKNAVNVGLDGRFAQFAGSLLDPERPLVVIAPVGREVETITRLGQVGFENVAGYLEGGACFIPPEHRSSQPRISPQQLAERLAGPEPPFVLDVRSNEEWRSAHLEGAGHIPLTELNHRLEEVPAEQPVVVHCASGYRSSMAASVLALHGRACVTDLMGGIAAWQQAGLPVVRPQADSAAST